MNVDDVTDMYAIKNGRIYSAQNEQLHTGDFSDNFKIRSPNL